MTFAIASNRLNISDNMAVRASKKAIELRSLSVAIFIFLMLLFANGKLINTANDKGCNKFIVTTIAISKYATSTSV